MKKIILLMITLITITGIITAREGNMINIEITVAVDYETGIKIGNFDPTFKSTMPSRIFETKKEVKLCESKFWADKGFFFERSSADYHPPKNSFITLEEYNINKEKYFDKNGNFTKEIIHKTLPKGTKFELLEIKLNHIFMGQCHYKVRLLDYPEYKNMEIEAVALTYIGGDVGHTWNSKWKFVDWKKEKIYTEKIPLFMPEWAKEIKEKK